MKSSKRTINFKISSQILEVISGRELLVKHLGYWPDFHDFEVLSLTLDRALVSAAMRDLRATFLVFDINKGASDPERKQGTVEFLFEDVENILIEGFNHQNPIIGLSITRPKPHGDAQLFSVEWGGTGMQHDVSFTCSRISVVRVIDLNPFQKVLPAF